MTRTTFMLLWTALALTAESATGQTRPDFSGRWTTTPQDSVAQEAGRQGGRGGRGGRTGDLGSGWGPNITITQDANRLTVEYAFFTRGDMQPPLRFVYALDGSETKNSVMMGRGVQVQTSRTAWSGAQLVITSLHTFDVGTAGQPMTSEVKQTLTLESPSSLIVETTRSGVLGGPPSTTRTVYRKL